MRPPLMEFMSKEQMKSWSAHELVFLLRKRPGSVDTGPMMAWADLGFKYIDQFTFAITNEGSAMARSLPGDAPSVHIDAPDSAGLKPIKFTGELTPERLERWVNFNQFPPVLALNPWTMLDAGRTGVPMVVLANSGGAADVDARKGFAKKATSLREKQQYLFGTINATDEDAGLLLSRAFSVIAAPPTSLPKIFAFSGTGRNIRYWEDPRFTRAEDLTLARVKALIEDEEAVQDDRWRSWVKGKRKIYIRFASSSMLAFCIAVLMPLLVMGGSIMWCRTLCAKDEPGGLHHEHAD